MVIAPPMDLIAHAEACNAIASTRTDVPPAAIETVRTWTVASAASISIRVIAAMATFRTDDANAITSNAIDIAPGATTTAAAPLEMVTGRIEMMIVPGAIASTVRGRADDVSVIESSKDAMEPATTDEGLGDPNSVTDPIETMIVPSAGALTVRLSAAPDRDAGAMATITATAGWNRGSPGRGRNLSSGGIGYHHGFL